MNYRFKYTNVYMEIPLSNCFIWVFDVSGRQYTNLNENLMLNNRSKIMDML